MSSPARGDGETGTESRGSEERTTAADAVLSVCAAFGFGLAQPLFDLLARGADFFVARQTPAGDILLLALGLGVLLPVALAAVVFVAHRLHSVAGAVVHALVLGALVAVFALQALERLPGTEGLSGVVLVLAALVVGAGTVALFYRKRVVRAFFRYAAVAPLVFAAIFLFASPVRAVAFPPDAAAGASAEGFAKAAPTVVFVVFDELPVVSLMDERGRIDGSLYPAFARLAGDATWYRNTTTVHNLTAEAVPALLSGVDPQAKTRLPTLANHPNNLFTFMRDGYEIHATEANTDLCPPKTCAATQRVPAFSPRWRSFLSDLRYAALHLYLPSDLTRGLPPVNQTFGNFEEVAPLDEEGGMPVNREKGRRPHVRVGALLRSREGRIEDFLASVRATDERTLFFLHALIPHGPYIYLPSGQRYACDPQLGRTQRVGGGWTDDPWLVTQQQQRHLLQAGYADDILGRLLEKLDAAGLYDDALLVVASDHGITFRPGADDIRGISTRAMQGDVAQTTLLIKEPGQKRGALDDDRVETTDIVPTLADLLGAELPWEVDGSPVDDKAPRAPSRMWTRTDEDGVELEPGLGPLREALAYKAELFGEGLFRVAPDGYLDLIGRELRDLRVGPEAAGSASLDQATELVEVDPDARVVPACVSGTLESDAPDPKVIAVSLNGEVVAVTRPDTDGRFVAMLPPDRLRSGRNDVRLLLAPDSAGEEFVSVRTG